MNNEEPVTKGEYDQAVALVRQLRKKNIVRQIASAYLTEGTQPSANDLATLRYQLNTSSNWRVQALAAWLLERVPMGPYDAEAARDDLCRVLLTAPIDK